METISELTINVRVDTAAARREIEALRAYALGVIEELKAAYALLGPLAPPSGLSGSAPAAPVTAGGNPRRRV